MAITLERMESTSYLEIQEETWLAPIYNNINIRQEDMEDKKEFISDQTDVIFAPSENCPIEKQIREMDHKMSALSSLMIGKLCKTGPVLKKKPAVVST